MLLFDTVLILASVVHTIKARPAVQLFEFAQDGCEVVAGPQHGFKLREGKCHQVQHHESIQIKQRPRWNPHPKDNRACYVQIHSSEDCDNGPSDETHVLPLPEYFGVCHSPFSPQMSIRSVILKCEAQIGTTTVVLPTPSISWSQDPLNSQYYAQTTYVNVTRVNTYLNPTWAQVMHYPGYTQALGRREDQQNIWFLHPWTKRPVCFECSGNAPKFTCVTPPSKGFCDGDQPSFTEAATVTVTASPSPWITVTASNFEARSDRTKYVYMHYPSGSSLELCAKARSNGRKVTIKGPRSNKRCKHAKTDHI